MSNWRGPQDSVAEGTSPAVYLSQGRLDSRPSSIEKG